VSTNPARRDADEYNYPEWDSETFNGLRVESNYLESFTDTVVE